MNKMLNQPNYTPSHDSNTYEIDITAILHELWKNRWMLLLLASIGLGLGFFYSLRQPLQYESSALLQVDTKQSGVLSGSLESFAGNNRANSVQTEMTLLQSRFVLEPVMKSLGLDIHVSPQLTTLKERLFPWLNKKNLSVPMFKVPESELNQTFQLMVDKPGHISLYNEEDDLVLSGKIGEVISTADGAFQLETVKNLVPEGTRFSLSKRSVLAGVRELASRLHVKEMSDQKQKFGGGTGILDVSLTGTNKREVVRILNAVVDEAREQNESKQTREADKTLAFLNKQLPKSKKALGAAENALAQYKAKMGKTGSKPQAQFLLQELTALDQQLSAFEIEKIQMKAEYKPAHPAWMVLDNKVKALKEHRDKVTESLKSLPASDQAVVHLMRDLKVKEKFNLLLLNSIQELEVRKAGIMSGINILSYAVLPDGALPTHSKFNGLSGVALGFMLGVMIVFARKLLLPRVDDPHWTERQLNLPNVVTLPYCKQQVENDERKEMRI
nr:hypothetical protein [Gammaproteobacteria bacterium]